MNHVYPAMPLMIGLMIGLTIGLMILYPPMALRSCDTLACSCTLP